MKILIGYDGSSCSEAALDDLQKAGLPDEVEVLIISVAEVWLPPPVHQTIGEYAANLQTKPQFYSAYEKSGRILSEAETFVNHAQKRVRAKFPQWNVRTEATYGSPAWEILMQAGEFKPDLIVVGSQGRSALNRWLLGSISQKVLTEAECSVRIARGKIEVDPFPVRIIIGFDGSKGAKAAVEAVASRKWREASEVRLIAATDLILPTTIGRFIPPVADWVNEEMKSAGEWIEKLAEEDLTKLRDAGFEASLHIYPGNPKQILVEEAQKWNADCIFVGANAFGSRVERLLIGSTSAAVAARAHCSVEIVRLNFIL